MRNTGFLKWVWIAGVAVWVSVVAYLLWRLPYAESYAQASFNSSRLMWVALAGIPWSIAPAHWRARLNKRLPQR